METLEKGLCDTRKAVSESAEAASDARKAVECAELCRKLVADNNRDIRQELDRAQESLRRSISAVIHQPPLH